MVTYAELRAARPNQFLDVAGLIRQLAESVASRGDEMSAAIDLLAAGWTGTASIAARNRLTTLRAELYGAYPGLVGIDQALTEFATALTQAQSAAAAAADPKPGSIVQVSPDGTVTLVPRFGAPDDRDFAEFDTISSAIATAVQAANDADAEVHQRLARIRLTVDDDQPMPTVPSGANPWLVAGWWNALSAAQQQYLIAMHPDIVDSLDGIPADARDQASRMLLHLQTATLIQQDRELRQGPRTKAAEAQVAIVDGELAGLTTLDNRVSDPNSVRAYLLDLDASNNRAIVSISDPDRATNTLTFVSGSGSGLSAISSTLAAIDNIHEAGTRLRPTDSWSPAEAGDLATIGWLDYAAPTNLVQAARLGPAQAAAGRLSAFTDGLRADSDQPNAHESVLGYSYGSVVTGLAATQGGLDTDDIVAVASPGMTANNASDLGVDPGHVWATVAKRDPIRLASDWFGRSPVDPSFGARTFTSNPGSGLLSGSAHTSYFNTDTPSLENIARIAVGDDADVY